MQDHEKVIRLVIEENNDPNGQVTINHIDAGEPMLFAIRSLNLDMIKLLVLLGGDPCR